MKVFPLATSDRAAAKVEHRIPNRAERARNPLPLRWPALLPLLSAVFLAACHQGAPPIVAPAVPTALAGINSAWDDFNAARAGNVGDIVFSTNRGSRGSHFDVWIAQVTWRENPGARDEPVPFNPQLMAPADDRGPLLLLRSAWDGRAGRTDYVLVLASERAGGRGGLDLYWAAGCPGNAAPCAGQLQALDALNTAANEAYLSSPFASRRVLMASDRAGNGYDLYEVSWPAGASLAGAPTAIDRIEQLSSDAEDNAPYVGFVDPVDGSAELVFASGRTGSLGERDIWCARFSAGQWSTPVHLSSPINSPADEFRPSIFEVRGTRFLMFSSNRPGGQGGYDLYAVGYAGCAQQPAARS